MGVNNNLGPVLDTASLALATNKDVLDLGADCAWKKIEIQACTATGEPAAIRIRVAGTSAEANNVGATDKIACVGGEPYCFKAKHLSDAEGGLTRYVGVYALSDLTEVTAALRVVGH